MIIKNQNYIYFSNGGEVLDTLPPFNYVFFKETKSLKEFPLKEIPKKLYGDIEEAAKHYLDGFIRSTRNIGVLLVGSKGSGKTLLSTILSTEGSKMGFPTININEEITTNEFNDLLSNISTPSIILIDEYDKIFKTEESQNYLLSVLDGNQSSKHLIILTANKEDEISEYMINRPGRIKYKKVFANLSNNEIEYICKEFALSEEDTDILKHIGNINYDTILTIINEMQDFNISLKKAIKLLNICPEKNNYQVNLLTNGKSHKTDFYGHPLLNKDITITYYEENSWRSSIIVLNRENCSVTFLEDETIMVEDITTDRRVVAYFTKTKKTNEIFLD